MKNADLLGLLAVVVATLSLVGPFIWRFLQRKRLEQEEKFHRESHNLTLFKALSSKRHHLQLAAAAVLVERLMPKLSLWTRLSLKFHLHYLVNMNATLVSEHRVIIRALLAVTKDIKSSKSDPGVSAELAKFIADQIAAHHKLPLADFDWQQSKLSGAWWKNIDARGVHFWRSDLSNVGMRSALLQYAEFVEVNLEKSVLSGANLTNAKFDILRFHQNPVRC